MVQEPHDEQAAGLEPARCLIDQTARIFVVFGIPLTRPGDREFLGAYSTPERAQEFVDAQDAAVRSNLAVVEVTINQHPQGDDFWSIPGETR